MNEKEFGAFKKKWGGGGGVFRRAMMKKTVGRMEKYMNLLTENSSMCEDNTPTPKKIN
jgi:hypothetical protein